ncbi:hypothetical protein LLEC1_02942 [Akanthomyces lecanii]|uniref:Mid2 domain-containing protein n=1 Tax=Cordyceps confragosa TaxID=2714763 RepID=A0A179I7H8_CORDF|nr:hypothetical protein LLEC1_02942 [Akanthomyces lecanii]
MTNLLHGPSLLQALDSHSVDPSPSSESTSHARSATHLHAHRHAHHPHAHDHSRHQDDSDNHHGEGDQRYPISRFDSAASPVPNSVIAESDLDDQASSDSSSLEARSLAAVVDAALAGRADDAASYVTQVVQTVSIVQVVDYSGSPISTSTEYATPNTVVVDPSSGRTISQSGPAFTIAVNPSSLLPGLGSDSSSTPSTTTSTHHTTSTSLLPSSAPIPPSSVSGFPTLSDTSNGTAWGNATAFASPSSSTTRPTTFTQLSNYNISTTLSNFHLLSTSSSSLSLSSTFTDTDTDTDTDTLTSSSYSSTYSSAPTSTWSSPTVIPTVAGSTEPSSTASNSGSDPLTTQQKQIVGGVVGSIAGVAFIALLVMLALRYRRKKDSGSLPSNRDGPGFAALPVPGSDATNSMAERGGAPSSVSAALAALTSKRQSRGATTRSSDMLEVPSNGERGFYRVSGRKLPSVLHTGGDGYSDPRESAMSQLSNSSEPFNRGDQHFALGTPMRPISGVPIMRSGPARTPVTEANPFADPLPSPPSMGNNDSPPRRPGSSSSARGSSSRFQESI